MTVEPGAARDAWRMLEERVLRLGKHPSTSAPRQNSEEEVGRG